MTEIRDDGPYENVFLNVGNKGDRSAYTRAVTPRLLQYTELEGLYEGDGFARRIVDLPAEEMVRAGYDVEGVEDDGDVRAELENIQALEKLCDAMRWASLYGGSIVVMLINDGGTLEDPLAVEKSKSLEQLRVYDRWQVTHYRKYLDPNDMRFGKTELYMVSPIEGTPYIVHESRCLVFDGVPVPDRVRERNDSWGASKLQQCYDQLTRFGMSHVWANALLERAQQAVHGIPELTNLLRAPGGEALVRKRVDLVDMTRSINNTIVIDAAESYDLKSTSLTGVSDIVDRLGLALSAVTGIPESLLFGRQQKGLGTNGQGDLENWYAKIGQEQNNILLPALDKLVTVQLYAMGKYVDDYLIKFNPLSVPSRKDTAETDYKRAQTFEILNNIGALDASEIRKMLPDEGYDIDDVGKLPELPDPVEATVKDDGFSPSQPRNKDGTWKDMGLSDSLISLGKANGKTVELIDSDEMARIAGGNAMAVHQSSTGKILLHKDVFRSEDSYAVAIKSSIETGFHPPAAKDPRFVLFHEMAHSSHPAESPTKHPSAGGFQKGRKRLLGNTPELLIVRHQNAVNKYIEAVGVSGITKELGSYGAKNSAELVAQAFAVKGLGATLSKELTNLMKVLEK